LIPRLFSRHVKDDQILGKEDTMPKSEQIPKGLAAKVGELLRGKKRPANVKPVEASVLGQAADKTTSKPTGG
jgi:hypothetical protein